MIRSTITRQMLAVVLALGLAAPACAAPRAQQQQQVRTAQGGAVQLPRPASVPFSTEQEIQLGREAAMEANRQLPVLPESHALSRYVSQLGQRLAAQTPSPQWPYVFRVINQAEINAFALPGGPVYINVGTVLAARSESELAGVIGHEIGHVYMRHGTAQASRAAGAGAVAQILGGLFGGGVGGTLARIGIDVAAGTFVLRYSREAERESDMIGAFLLHNVGLNPQGMVTFFEQLQGEGGPRGPEWLSSHPNPGNRAQNVNQIVQQLPRRQLQADSTEFQRIKQVAAQLKPMTAKEIAEQQKRGGFGNGGGVQTTGQTGQVGAGAITPSAQFVTMNHRDFRIAYPENWEVFGDERSGVVIAPRAGISGNQIGVGAVLERFQPAAGTRTLDEATDQLIRQLQQANPQMRTVGSPRRIRVNNIQSTSVDLLGQSPLALGGQPVRERNWLVAVPLQDGSLLYAVFVSPEPEFDRLRPTYENMVRSLRVQ